MTLKVDRTPAVSKQMRDLAERAKTRRIREAYLDALTFTIDQLQRRPLEWGDPDYRMKTPGGLICHGVVWPLIVRYAVFESAQIALIFEIVPLPTSPLADI